ncbi:SEC14-like protein [Actinidia chinensis var. chinensis]|uniref:SEC14-like protein n=1 Tax=Actinidia chinensis var. chinensis TaxID=1590841 RepID=A0A2R6R8K8_ACTCC|nr:SEC14-like protein [Actinidia chinensis var. chinensis]
MASTEGLVPITRTFLASYYDKYPFPPLSHDVSRLSTEIRSMANDVCKDSSLTQGESLLVQEAERQPPHKIDENMWKNREQIEEILFLLETSHWPKVLQQQTTSEDVELASILGQLKNKFQNALKILEFFQSRNSEYVFNTVMTYMPQDFRGKLIRQQRERSERNKQAEVDDLVSSGGSLRDRYALLWKQQMERRRQLAQLGSATGVYKTLVKYLVGVPQVLLDFIRQINDDQGPMEEQRQRYGPPLYSLTTMVLNIRLFLSLLLGRFDASKPQKHQIAILEEAVGIYTSEFERFIKFLGEVFANSPFFITAEVAGAIEGRKSDEYKEISIPAGKTYEVSLSVESINSYIAWDFSLSQGKVNMDIGFSVEHTDNLGQKTLILPYRRYESDQGNFCTCMAGNYKLIWDNSYSTFFKKVLRYKVDCIPPVVESAHSATEVEG